MDPLSTPERFLATVNGRSGHFELESGHHGDFWMDLETLCLRPETLRPFVFELAAALRPLGADVLCGPLNEGAFVALMAASEIGCDFSYAERFADLRAGETTVEGEGSSRADLFPVGYRLPQALHPVVRGRRVAIVNDVISAGSAVRGALADLQALGAQVIAVAALLVLGDAFVAFARERHLPLVALARRPSHLWTPAECPLCRKGVALERLHAR